MLQMLQSVTGQRVFGKPAHPAVMTALGPYAVDSAAEAAKEMLVFDRYLQGAQLWLLDGHQLASKSARLTSCPGRSLEHASRSAQCPQDPAAQRCHREMRTSLHTACSQSAQDEPMVPEDHAYSSLSASWLAARCPQCEFPRYRSVTQAQVFQQKVHP